MEDKHIKRLSDDDVQEFIFEHETEDENKLSLKHKTLYQLPFALIAQQLVGRRKSKEKLPLWFRTKGVVYPPSLNLEQSSSEATALYKERWLAELVFPKKHLVDLTGGLGVDTFFVGRLFERTTSVEPNQELLSLAKHNHQQLGNKTISYFPTSATQWLAEHNQAVSLFYLDPSRRKNSGKVFRLSDCEPNTIELQHLLFQQSEFVLIKASPLLDIQQGLRELTNVEHVKVVAVENEVKELLFFQHFGFEGEATIEAIHLTKEGNVKETFSFLLTQEKELKSEPSVLQTYLYEPNAAILKTGAFKSVALQFNVEKIHPHTHLYSSENLEINFPGRIFKIETVNPTPSDFNKMLPEGKVNVITRNYPLAADKLKKKLKLKDGGNKYVIGFSEEKRKTIVIASRVK